MTQNDDTDESRIDTMAYDCDRCEGEVTEDNWGATLYDDGVGLRRHDGVVLCEGCRDDFENWLESTARNG